MQKVAVRAPPFWPDEPELWFAQLEGQFTLSGITQDATMYAHVLSQLDTKYVREVKDIITNPPAQGRYQTIKNALIQRLSESQEHRTRQLLEHEEELGDRKPSQFLRHLKTLARTAIPEQLLRTLSLGRLPPQVQIILATRSQDRLEEVAAQADRIQEVTYRSVAEVTSTADSNAAIVEQISKLAKQFNEFHRRRERALKPRGRARSKSRDRQQQQGLCFYHQRFGKEVR